MTEELKVRHLETFVRGAGIRVVGHRRKVHTGLCLVPDFSPGPADAHLYVCERRLARLARRADGWWFVVGNTDLEARTLSGLVFWLAAELWERAAATGNTITEAQERLDTSDR